MPPGNNKNAKLVVHWKDKTEEIPVMFNPESYSIKKSNQFASHGIPGRDSPVIQFMSGQAESLTVTLFFDTYTFEDGKDVRKEYTDKISKLMLIDEHLHAPPVCEFNWAKHSFTGIIENVDTNYTMFDEDGTPVRATVNLSFTQYTAPEKPKSSPDRTKRRVIREGDSLWGLAAKEYGDASKWKVIADANNIDNPRVLKTGRQIVIPPLG